jgi:hypothetical protein
VTPERLAEIRDIYVDDGPIAGDDHGAAVVEELLNALDAANAEKAELERLLHVQEEAFDADTKLAVAALDAANAEKDRLQAFADGERQALIETCRREAQPADEDDPRAADWLNEHQS